VLSRANACADGVDLEPGTVRTHAHERAAVARDLRAVLPRGVQVAVVTDGDVDPPVGAEGDVVRRVIGASHVEAEAEIADDVVRLVGDPVAVRVAVRREIGRVHHVHGVPVDGDAARAVGLGEDRVAVGVAVAVRVDEPHHAPAPLHRALREVEVDADVDGAVGRRRDDGRIHRERGPGVVQHREPVGRLHLREHLALVRRVARDDAALREGGAEPRVLLPLRAHRRGEDRDGERAAGEVRQRARETDGHDEWRKSEGGTGRC